MTALTPEEHARIADAIRAAEATTSGEIFAVVARQSDSYRALALLSAAAVTLAAGVAAGLVLPFVLGLFDAAPDWTAQGEVSLRWRAIDGTALAIGQLLLFLLLAALSLVPRLRLFLVPRALRRRRAHARAVEQFLAHNLHATDARTGVLLFVSLAERYAEVIADRGIDALVDQSVWDALVRQLVEDCAAGRVADGFVAGVATAGRILAPHFPPSVVDENELPDALVEI